MPYTYLINSNNGYAPTFLTHEKQYTQYEMEKILAAIRFELGTYSSYGEIIKLLILNYDFEPVTQVTI